MIYYTCAILIFLVPAFLGESFAQDKYSKLSAPSHLGKAEKNYYLNACELVAKEPQLSPIWNGKTQQDIQQAKKNIITSQDIPKKTGGFLMNGNSIIDGEGNVISASQQNPPDSTESSDIYVGCLLMFGWSWGKPNIESVGKIENRLHFLLLDSKTLLGGLNLYWMDNDRVIFTTPSEVFCTFENSQSPPKNLRRIAVFDTKSLSVTPYGKDVGVVNLCYADGRIHYSKPPAITSTCSNQLEDIHGLWGREQVVEGRRREGIFEESCLTWSEHPKPPWIDWTGFIANKFKPLKPEHGWLEHEPIPSDVKVVIAPPVAIYPPNTDRGKGISIRNAFPAEFLLNNPGIGRKRYEAYKRAYLFSIAHNYPTLPDRQSIMWRLYPSGAVEEVIRWRSVGDWLHISDQQIIPSMAGTFVIVGRHQGKLAPGIYVTSKDKQHLKPVLSGDILHKTHSLSPDGCKLAFGMKIHNDPPIAGKDEHTLHTLDLCSLAKLSDKLQ